MKREFSEYYPDDPVNRYLIEQLAIEFWRSRKSFEIEQKRFTNSEIESRRNLIKKEFGFRNPLSGIFGEFSNEEEIKNYENMGDEIPCSFLSDEDQILLRYSTAARNNINRIIFILEARNRNGFVSKK